MSDFHSFHFNIFKVLCCLTLTCHNKLKEIVEILSFKSITEQRDRLDRKLENFKRSEENREDFQAESN